MPDLQFFTESAADAAVDTAISSVLLRRVAAGEVGASARLHPTAPSVAFGRPDRNAAGYPDAVAAARRHGFEAIERLAGGRAAVFHEGTLAFSMVMPIEDVRTGITDRFRAITDVVVAALVALGVDARVGEVPGEYCPGAWSVNAGGRLKLAGFGQRLVKGAAHVGGVVVVDGADRIRDVLVPVYDALGLAWEPTTAGEVGAPGVADALTASLSSRYDVVHAPLPEPIVTEARESASDFVAP